MPTFCRHGRLEERCPICSRQPRVKPGTVTGQAAARMARDRAAPKPKTGKPAAPSKRRTPRAGDLKVRRVHRAVDDGYENALVPGLRASDDARRLAAEIAFSAGRLAVLRDAPPDPLAGAAGEEGLWTVFLTAYLSPLEGADEPFAEIERVRTPWAADELPDLTDVELGPRTAHAAGRGTDTLEAYRARAQKAGGQIALLSAEASLTPARRFDRAFERLSLPRFPRAARYELLVLAGTLGLLDVAPSSLQLAAAEPMDPVLLAAKRIFGIGDAINLQRRVSELVAATGVEVAALDLALANWGGAGDERVTGGIPAAEDETVRELVATALGV